MKVKMGIGQLTLKHARDPPEPPPRPPLEEELPLFDHELLLLELQSSEGLVDLLVVSLDPHESVPQVSEAAGLGAGGFELTPAHSSAAALLPVGANTTGSLTPQSSAEGAGVPLFELGVVRPLLLPPLAGEAPQSPAAEDERGVVLAEVPPEAQASAAPQSSTTGVLLLFDVVLLRLVVVDAQASAAADQSSGSLLAGAADRDTEDRKSVV